MPELDLRHNPRGTGYPHDPVTLYNDLFFLAIVFGASRDISKFRENQYDTESAFSLFSIFRTFEYSEASKRLLAVAVICRNELDNTQDRDLNIGYVGEIKNLNSRSAKRNLDLRTACNKIVHAKDINFDLTVAKDVRSGYLKPTVYLYGQQETRDSVIEWRATLRIFDFIEAVFTILP